jgi:sRNA-binding carbon storage regulator CsrA
MAAHSNDSSKDKMQQEYLQSIDDTMGQVKKDIIDHYDKVQTEIDLRTEKLLLNLPAALKLGREELLERVKEEKEKSLAALSPDSALIRYKNEYYQQFLQLKNEFDECKSDDLDEEKKKQELYNKFKELKQKVQVIEDFLDDFKNRTLTFEEADKSVYAALIGELVTSNELSNQLDSELNNTTEIINA